MKNGQKFPKIDFLAKNTDFRHFLLFLSHLELLTSPEKAQNYPKITLKPSHRLSNNEFSQK
jgi:hypothetical protein